MFVSERAMASAWLNSTVAVACTSKPAASYRFGHRVHHTVVYSAIVQRTYESSTDAGIYANFGLHAAFVEIARISAGTGRLSQCIILLFPGLLLRFV